MIELLIFTFAASLVITGALIERGCREWDAHLRLMREQSEASQRAREMPLFAKFSNLPPRSE